VIVVPGIANRVGVGVINALPASVRRYTVARVAR
jgi:hypothetical protein